MVGGGCNCNFCSWPSVIHKLEEFLNLFFIESHYELLIFVHDSFKSYALGNQLKKFKHCVLSFFMKCCLCKDLLFVLYSAHVLQ